MKEIIYSDSFPHIDNLTGTIYSYANVIRTIQTKDSLIKSTENFGYDEDLAYECLEIWNSIKTDVQKNKKYGYKGYPSSPASFINNNKLKHNVRWSTNIKFKSFFTGGWIENMKSGFTMQPVYHYDINKAYLWALSQGLPKRVFPYTKTMKHHLFVVRQQDKNHYIPSIYNTSLCIYDEDDMDFFGIKGEVIDAVSWNDNQAYVYDNIMEFENVLPPKAFKMLQKSFWGRWAADNELLVDHYRDGKLIKSRSLKNNFQNYVWSTIIIHRIIRSVFSQWLLLDGINVYVDAILSRKEMENNYIGNDIGKWKLENKFENGIYIDRPGTWDVLPLTSKKRITWYKHSGFSFELLK